MEQSVRTPESQPDRPRTPVRTCVGCRRREEQATLLRVVATPSQDSPSGWALEPDERRRRQGRGAYVHADPECVHTAMRRNAFGRALRLGGRPDGQALQRWVGQHT